MRENSVSPKKPIFSLSKTSEIWPAVWPGVSITRASSEPTLTLSPELRAAVEAGPDDTLAWLTVVGALAEGRTVLSLEYERTAQLVADLELPAGELLVKGELGWAPRRALRQPVMNWLRRMVTNQARALLPGRNEPHARNARSMVSCTRSSAAAGLVVSRSATR